MGKYAVDDGDNGEASPFSLCADLSSCHPILYMLV